MRLALLARRCAIARVVERYSHPPGRDLMRLWRIFGEGGLTAAPPEALPFGLRFAQSYSGAPAPAFRRMAASPLERWVLIPRMDNGIDCVDFAVRGGFEPPEAFWTSAL